MTIIKTEIAAKRFANSLEEKKTFFLNGAWGSGKTSFLNSFYDMPLLKRAMAKIIFYRYSNRQFFSDVVDGNSNFKWWQWCKRLKHYLYKVLGYRNSEIELQFTNAVSWHSKKRLKYLELWSIKDDRPVSEITFNVLHPVLYWSVRIFVISAVVISILNTKLVDLGLEHYLPNGRHGLIWQVLGVVVLTVAVWQIFKTSADRFYTTLLKITPNTLFGRYFQKILVVDDFDRVSEEAQIAMYKVFNVIQHKLTVLFVGDYSLIAENESNYTSKIIDERRELPVDLQPFKLWEYYFYTLSKEFGYEPDSSLYELFNRDLRNLRDREKFDFYVQKKLKDSDQYTRLMVDQQLAIIYLFLFYPKIYVGLQGGLSLKNISQKLPGEYISESDLNVFQIILEGRSTIIPKSFDRDQSAYFINEHTYNVSTTTLDEILINEESFKSHLKSDDTQYSAELNSYLQQKYNVLIAQNPGIKENIIDWTLDEVVKKTKSDFLQFMVNISVIQLGLDFDGNVGSRDANKYAFDTMTKMLEERGVTDKISQAQLMWEYDMFPLSYLANKYSFTLKDIQHNHLGDVAGLLIYVEHKYEEEGDVIYEEGDDAIYRQWDDEMYDTLKAIEDQAFIIFGVWQGFIKLPSGQKKTTEDRLLLKTRQLDVAMEYSFNIPKTKIPTELREIITERINGIESDGYIINRVH